ncbi:MAG: M48 family metallopeptidase [Chromatiales bacterium]|nr:M48 family metallopeptidase [Chromatiales bacterium]
MHLVLDDRHGLELRTPVWTRLSQVENVIRHNSEWIRCALEKYQARRVGLCEGTVLPLLDESLQLAFRFAHRATVERRADQLLVSGHDIGEGEARALLEKWYRARAQETLEQRLVGLGDQTGLHHNRLTIRAQRARWGSCTSRGNISLNWRLMLLPSTLVDYVLLHELCHLRHLNHSPAFWALLGSFMADYEARAQRINEVQSRGLAL